MCVCTESEGDRKNMRGPSSPWIL